MMIASLKIKELVTGRFELKILVPFGDQTCVIAMDEPYSTIEAARYQAIRLAKQFHLTFKE